MRISFTTVLLMFSLKLFSQDKNLAEIDSLLERKETYNIFQEMPPMIVSEFENRIKEQSLKKKGGQELKGVFDALIEKQKQKSKNDFKLSFADEELSKIIFFINNGGLEVIKKSKKSNQKEISENDLISLTEFMASPLYMKMNIILDKLKTKNEEAILNSTNQIDFKAIMKKYNVK